jgi:hypothetical protein
MTRSCHRGPTILTGLLIGRSVAAGFRSVVEALAPTAGPVLLAIDDLQWLDTSSRLVIGFGTRRMPTGTGLLATLRTDPDNPASATWVQLRDPQSVRRMSLPPFGLAVLRELLVTRLGRSFPHAVLARIHDIRLPDSLAELVRTRIDRLPDATRVALLAASCSSTPTVELVAHATESDPETVIAVLADALDDGIVRLDGHHIRFTHPLLAHGVHDGSSFAQRRAMHRRLAEFETEPELRARHLAMAAVRGDPHTLACLDTGARSARRRGRRTGRSRDRSRRRHTAAANRLCAQPLRRRRR